MTFCSSQSSPQPQEKKPMHYHRNAFIRSWYFAKFDSTPRADLNNQRVELENSHSQVILKCTVRCNEANFCHSWRQCSRLRFPQNSRADWRKILPARVSRKRAFRAISMWRQHPACSRADHFFVDSKQFGRACNIENRPGHPASSSFDSILLAGRRSHRLFSAQSTYRALVYLAPPGCGFAILIFDIIGIY